MLELIIDEHEQNLNAGTHKNNRDIVDEMISLSRNNSSANYQELAKLIDRPSIKSIMIDIITASIDTSFTSIEWILTELMRHPSAMKKCQDELASVVGLDRMVEETDLPKLEYLYMVVKEGDLWIASRTHLVGACVRMMELFPVKDVKDVEDVMILAVHQNEQRKRCDINDFVERDFVHSVVGDVYANDILVREDTEAFTQQFHFSKIDDCETEQENEG
ncbi:hypothetical protein POM88_021677 [Heracleum sosnowskyi]|uniref:Cytochrome P450 n=1 Tax=Heracleum sosnowskyi TaxID=360622 RepID=A0AAD8MT08_9APIA|nr:hypothetical protein POM88_021677 [Heracleum sosnowskyi]